MSKMALKKAHIRFSYKDYLLLSGDARCEILEGELRPVPAFDIKHQEVALKIAAALLLHVEAGKLGRVFRAPCDVVFSEETVMQPDILFVARKRRGIIGEANLRGVPDLIIDVLSRATRERDFKLRRKIYARFEVQEYWVVDSDANTVETLVWSEIGYVSVGNYRKPDKVSSPLLPDLNLMLSPIFGGSDP